VLGEVQRTDGTCQKITAEVIEEMKALVREKKRLLDEAEAAYNHPTAHRVSADIMGASGALLYAHEEYRKALDLLLAMMALYTPPVAATTTATTTPLGPEFVEGAWVGKPHCEAWTVNSTCGATANECAVVCRHQPFCKGFALNKAQGDMCVWFDYKMPDPTVMQPDCAGPPEGLHSFWTKERNVTTDGSVLGAMEKVRITSELLESVMNKADSEAQVANQSLIAWEAETNSSLKDSLEVFFLDAKRNYTKSLADAKVVREERAAAVQDALEKIRADGEVVSEAYTPPLPSSTTTTLAPTTQPAVVTTTTPPPPVVELHWSDFPNSEDSKWAEEHPECPMGPPCFCDCKCRGAPPQNFVEPPPPLPAPCPGPPPLPPASAFSMPLGAPALSPALMR